MCKMKVDNGARYGWKAKNVGGKLREGEEGLVTILKTRTIFHQHKSLVPLLRTKSNIALRCVCKLQGHDVFSSKRFGGLSGYDGEFSSLLI